MENVILKSRPVHGRILDALKGRRGSYVSGEDLSRRLKVSRNTVWKHVQALRGLGYGVESHPHDGYRLTGELDRLWPYEIEPGLRTRKLGRELRCYMTAASTNDIALQLAREGAAEGTVVTAEAQSRGRGRQGRAWFAAKGGLAFSVILRPQLHPDEVAALTLASAVAVARAMEGFKAKPEIKWPNDILLEGKKVCGILTEMQAEQDGISHGVVGIGVNVVGETAGFPVELRGRATSLSLHAGKTPTRVALLREILFELEEAYGWLQKRQFSRVIREWRQRAVVIGRQVRVVQGDHSFFGQARDVDERGALLVRNDLGMVERVTAGDVEILDLKKPRKH